MVNIVFVFFVVVLGYFVFFYIYSRCKFRVNWFVSWLVEFRLYGWCIVVFRQ